MGHVGTDTTRFGFELYRRLAGTTTGNLVCSPYSVAAVLAMARAGARGETAEQLRALLGDDQLPALARLERSLAARGDGTGVVRINTANRLWAQAGLRWAAEFLDTLEQRFGAAPAMADFARDPDGTRREINAWVAERTQRRITELLAAGTVPADTRLVLVNAVHLKTAWFTPFRPEATRPGPFHRVDGSTTETMFMTGGAHAYASGPGWTAVQLFCHGELDLVVVLPDPGRFAEVESAVDGAWLTGPAFRFAQVELQLPRWTTRYAADLTPALRELGIPLVFSAAADFSGMTTDEPIFASAVVQQSFLAVDEQGIEAAAATAMVMAAGGAPPEPVSFTADRPFLYVLRDSLTGTPLFIGRISDPTVQETDT